MNLNTKFYYASCTKFFPLVENENTWKKTFLIHDLNSLVFSLKDISRVEKLPAKWKCTFSFYDSKMNMSMISCFFRSYSWRLSQKHRGKEDYYFTEKVTWFQTSRFTAKEIWAAVEQSRKKPRSSVRDLLIRGYKLKLHKCGPVAFSETHFNMLSPMFIFSAFALRDLFTTTVLAFKFLFKSMLR